MRREEVNFDITRPVTQVNAIWDYTVNFTIHRVWAKYGGQEVTKVPPGEPFEIHVDYSCELEGFTMFGIQFWVISLTASIVDVYDNTKLYSASKSHGEMVLDNPSDPIMPEYGIVIGIQPWASMTPTDYFSPPPKPW